MAYASCTFVRDPTTGQALFDADGYPQPATDWLYNDGGVVAFLTPPGAQGWPLTSADLSPGAFYANGLTIAIVGGFAPVLGAAPVYFGSGIAPGLLILGAAGLPTASPATGSGQLWNNGGQLCVA